ncbi:MAG TPA: hypothetical protein VFJ24_00530 [Gaiellales bacterium]|nr:hypothetical protein [Gaiellales bacterium]
MSPMRALAFGQIASFRDGWVFRSTIAKKIGASVRTVGRAIRQAKDLGLLGTARAKKTEIPPGMSRPLACGWSHRWIIGWGQAGKAVAAAVSAARTRRLAKLSAKGLRPVAQPQRRRWTAEELERELELTARKIPPPEPDPPPEL